MPAETATLDRPRPTEIITTRPGHVRLRVTTRGETRETTGTGPTVTLGSDPRCAVTVDDRAVSRGHCELTLHESGVMLTDTSKNGTWIEGARIVDKAWLPVGCAFTMGNTTVTLLGVDDVSVSVSTKSRFGQLRGKGPLMGELFAKLERVAATDIDVLCIGETGTGKDLVARGIHDASSRKGQPFVVVDCTTLNDGIADGILFGHRKGVFTGATDDRAGLLESADGGTVFLDEIGELPLDLQPKLLRCLENRQTRRLGESEYRGFDARIIAATNRHLLRMISEGTFRADLFYRIATVQLHVPALRNRDNGNVALLADLFLERIAEKRNLPLRFNKDVYLALEAHHWPGNVRELYNAITAAASFVTEPVIRVGDLPTFGDPDQESVDPREVAKLPIDVIARLAKLPWIEARALLGEQYAMRLMTLCDGNQSRAANMANVHRNTFRKLLDGEG
jgi:DNA-binding NtrC family response regulator